MTSFDQVLCSVDPANIHLKPSHAAEHKAAIWPSTSTEACARLDQPLDLLDLLLRRLRDLVLQVLGETGADLLQVLGETADLLQVLGETTDHRQRHHCARPGAGGDERLGAQRVEGLLEHQAEGGHGQQDADHLLF